MGRFYKVRPHSYPFEAWNIHVFFEQGVTKRLTITISELYAIIRVTNRD